MIIGAALFATAFLVGFAYLTVEALSSGKLRGLGWSVEKTEAPIRYWAGVGAYGLNTLLAAGFAGMLVTIAIVR